MSFQGNYFPMKQTPEIVNQNYIPFQQIPPSEQSKSFIPFPMQNISPNSGNPADSRKPTMQNSFNFSEVTPNIGGENEDYIPQMMERSPTTQSRGNNLRTDRFWHHDKYHIQNSYFDDKNSFKSSFRGRNMRFSRGSRPFPRRGRDFTGRQNRSLRAKSREREYGEKERRP